MKTAFVHDRIMNIGGAEKVFFDMIRSNDFEQAEIFTLFSQRKSITINDKVIKINSVISSNFLLNKFGYRNFMPLFIPLVHILSQKIKKYNPDNAIISSFAIAKNIDFHGPKTVYIHSPMQYIRDNYDEYTQKFTFPKKQIYIFVSKYLRKWDLKYTKFEKTYANSQYTQGLIKNIYKINSEILYPKIHKDFIDEPSNEQKKDYFVYVGRLVRYVREVEKIINLFNNSGENLIIIGDGPDADYLKTLAGNNIIFMGYLDQENDSQRRHLIKIIKQSRGFINLSKESFGISTAESLSLGTPVFGFNGGGTAELVNDNNGVLINTKNEKDIFEGFKKFKDIEFKKEEIKKDFLKKYERNINY